MQKHIYEICHAERSVTSPSGFGKNTARYWDRDGKIRTIRTPAGHRRYDIDSVINPIGDTRIRILYARVSSYKQKSDLERQADYLQSLFTDGKLGHCKSAQDSTTSEKDFYPFWDKSCQEMSEKLWSATKTDLSGLVLTLSSGSVSKKIANSWFSTEVTYLQNEKWLRISLPSSMFSVADSTDSESTSLLSKKIRVYPETALAKTWSQWISAARWCFNQAIAILKTQKIGKYDLRKTVMDMAPSWVSQTPYNPRQLAVFQAYEAHKAARRSGGDAKFRSVREPVKSIRFHA